MPPFTKGCGHLFEKKMNFLNRRIYFVPSLAEIRSVLLKNKILNFVNVFSQFRHYPSSSQMLCAKSGCNLPSGKSGEDVQMLSICIFAIMHISPLKTAWSFIWKKNHYPGMLCARFGWNWPSGSGKVDIFFSLLSPLGKGYCSLFENVNPLVHLFLLFRNPSIACYVASFLLLYVVNDVAS